MNRRSFLGAAATTAMLAPAPAIPVSAEEQKENEVRYILGTYAMLSPAKRSEFRQQLADNGMPEFAEAFLRFR